MSSDLPGEPEDDPTDPFRLGDDPGWDLRTRGDRPDGLIGLRVTFLALCAALLVVGIIVGLLADSVAERDGQLSGVVAALGVVAVGAIGLAVVRVLPVGLDGADELALARSWRSRFFGRCTASILPSLAGFAGFALSGVPALYPLGLAFTAAGLAVSGPFHATLVRDQEHLAIDGCVIPLVPALRHPVDDLTR